MAIDTSSLATITGIYKNVYEGVLAPVYNDMVVGRELAQKKSAQFRGGSEVFAVQMARAGGTGYGKETDALPTPIGPQVTTGSVTLKRLFSTFYLSHDAIERSKGDEAAYRELLGYEVETHLKMMRKHHNRMFYGDGRGILATSAKSQTMAKNTDTQLTFDTTRYLEPGMIVALWTNATDTSSVLADGGAYSDSNSVEKVSVKSVDSSVLATFTDGDTAADATLTNTTTVRQFNDRTGTTAADNNVISGLRLFADDGSITATVLGISRTTYPRWQGQLVSATSENLSRDHLYRLWDKIYRQSGEMADTCIFDLTARREYLNILQPDIRFAPVKDTDAGYDAEDMILSVGGKACRLIVDVDVPFGTIFMFPKSQLVWWELSPLELDQSTGSPLKQAQPFTWGTGSGDVFFGYLREKGNYGSFNAASFGAITGLNYTAE